MPYKPGRTPFLPKAAIAGLKTASVQVLGGLLLLGAGLLAVALATYASSDPSFNTASDGPIRNALGRTGALVADLGLQGFGLGTWIPVLGFGALGLRMFLGRRISLLPLRIVALVVAMVSLCGAFDLVPAPSSWRAGSSLGGWTGALAHDLLARLFESLSSGGTGGALTGLATGLLVPFVLCLLALPGALALLWSLGLLRGLAVVLGALERRRQRTAARAPADRRPAARRRAVPVFTGPELPPVVLPPGTEAAHPAPEPPAPPRIIPVTPRRPAPEPPPFLQAPEPDPAPGLSPFSGPAPDTHPPVTLIVADSARPARAPLVPLPSLNLLRASPFAGPGTPAEAETKQALAESCERLRQALADFGVSGTVSDARRGPVVTFYVFTPAEGTNPSRVRGLADDIARRMDVPHARVASYEGFSWLGIELANPDPQECRLYDILSRKAFQGHEGMVPLVLGRDVCGAPVVEDLTRMPFYLVAGTEGTGKTTALAAVLLSLVYRLTPRDARFLVIDTGRRSLAAFDGIPHLVTPVITDTAAGLNALKWLLREMEHRYTLMNTLSVRTIEQYNLKVREAHASGNPLRRKIQTGFSETGAPIFESQTIDSTPLGYLVVVIDEIAEMMAQSPDTVETAFERLAAVSRALGIHVIASTGQVNARTLTPRLQALFTHRGCFRTANKLDSRFMVTTNGAERLPSPGEMLFFHAGVPTERIHAPHVTADEIRRVCDFLRDQAPPSYIPDVTAEAEMDPVPAPAPPRDPRAPTLGQPVIRAQIDPLYDRAVEVVVRSGRVSQFLLQKQLRIGAPRASAIIRRMEQEGLVSAPNLAGKRSVIAGKR
ncbi:DNA translocase FtsK [Phaeovibrio sulfidiphilus]|uniref:DNA translocase FtsK n=1 Tax=Phaeovibrio sulfidiphilus TaxID=1220600 RepID=A0A8J6YLZ0_9PROT|nr:DNA translocase FtsK 4TM domain-containing protein [Phaeovibrio sulfidiphilus]MBE1236249.1 DNA translocase FtsK [Phaeovibrio sulfidiphilus]